MTYWLDTDVLIQAKNKPYKMERVPQFWTFLSSQLEAGVIKASKLVYEELIKGNDDLANWCKQRKAKGLCVSPNEDVQKCYAKIAVHVFAKYSQHQASIFLNGADGWVIAHALVDGDTVVSLELPKRTKTAIKIPTVCKVLGVKCIDTYDMLDSLDFKA